MTLTRVLRLLAWLLLAGLVFVTLSPIDLRPVSVLPTDLERAAAMALVGFVFAFAYPRQIWIVALLVLGAMVLLELLQLVAASRHARISDVVVKAIGGVIGLVAGWLAARRWRHD